MEPTPAPTSAPIIGNQPTASGLASSTPTAPTATIGDVALLSGEVPAIVIQFEASLESLDAAAQDDLSARVLDDVEVRAARLFASITVAGFAAGSVVVTLSGGGSAATLATVRFMPDSQITMSMACAIASDTDGAQDSYRLIGASGRIVSAMAQYRGVLIDTTTTDASQAELNTGASAAGDNGTRWVPIVIVVLFVVLLIGAMVMWRKREQANADVLAGLRTARQSSKEGKGAFGASAGSPGAVAFVNPTYGTGTGKPQGLGYLEVEVEPKLHHQFVIGNQSLEMTPQYGGDTYTDDAPYADGDDVTYAVPLEPGDPTTPAYDTYDPASVSGGEAHYAIPMEGGAGVALGNSMMGYAATKGAGIYHSPANSSPTYQTAVELGNAQNSSV